MYIYVFILFNNVSIRCITSKEAQVAYESFSFETLLIDRAQMLYANLKKTFIKVLEIRCRSNNPF